MAGCKQRVYGPRVTSSMCAREALPGSDYCKQHGLRHQKHSADNKLFRIDRRVWDWREAKVSPIAVVSFTESTFIDVQGRRNKRETEYYNHFESEEEARSSLLNKAEKELGHLEARRLDLIDAISRLLATDVSQP